MSCYNEFISSIPKWIFAGVYADFGLSGTKDTRPEFQRMISGCKAGKIDLIIVKSISRFSRNTVYLLGTVRMLDEIVVDVFFEEQNLNIKSTDGELLLIIYALIAQEESRTISENVKWGKRVSYKNGNVSFAYSHFLGYKKENDKIVVDKEQAIVVRQIYQWFLRDGLT